MLWLLALVIETIVLFEVTYFIARECPEYLHPYFVPFAIVPALTVFRLYRFVRRGRLNDNGHAHERGANGVDGVQRSGK
jgi:hypothetical protein